MKKQLIEKINQTLEKGILFQIKMYSWSQDLLLILEPMAFSVVYA